MPLNGKARPYDEDPMLARKVESVVMRADVCQLEDGNSGPLNPVCPHAFIA